MRKALRNLRNKTEKFPFITVTQKVDKIQPIFVADLSEVVDLDEITKYCKDELMNATHKDSKRGLDIRLDYVVKAWHSDARKCDDFPALNSLFNAVRDKLFSIDTHYSYYLDTFWINFYSKGEGTTVHNHRFYGGQLNGTDFSCVFYPYVENDCAPLSILNDKTFVDIPVKSGKLIMFPADVYHRVKEQESDAKRFSIAINSYKHQLHKPLTFDY